MNRRIATVMASGVAAVVMLSGCNPGSTGHKTYYKNGPAGIVVDRDAESDGTYELETKSNGKKHEFNVSYTVYKDCKMFRYYPTCVHHRNSLHSPLWNRTHKNAKSAKRHGGAGGKSFKYKPRSRKR